jgi:hypothetical protein
MTRRGAIIERTADRRNLAEARKVNDGRLSSDHTAIARSLRLSRQHFFDPLLPSPSDARFVLGSNSFNRTYHRHENPLSASWKTLKTILLHMEQELRVLVSPAWDRL